MRDSLYRNSIFLLLNMGVTAISGFLFWIIAAHLFSTVNVGKATALYSAVGLIGALSNLGLARTVVRFLAKSEDKSRDIVTKIILSILGALFFSLLISIFLPHFKFRNASLLLVATLCISGVVFTLKNLLDSIFIALRSSSDTLIENSVTNTTRLVLLFVFASSGYLGIFISQIAGAFLALIAGVIILVSKHGIILTSKPSTTTMAGLWSFSIGSYLNDLVGGLPSTVVPLLVVTKLGPTSSAYWYISMQVATVLFLICASINQSLFAEAAYQEDTLLVHTKKAAKAMSAIVVPLAVVVIVLAPKILGIFGAQYQEATSALRLLTLSSLLVAGNYITGTILNIFKKIWYLTIVNAVNLGVVVVGVALLGTNLNRIAEIWLIGEVVNIVLFGGGVLYALSKKKPIGELLACEEPANV